MSIFRVLATVALLTIGADLPAFAQAAIQEPGAYAFNHPDADVLNAGRSPFRSFDSTRRFSSGDTPVLGAYRLGWRTPSRHHRKR
jgi:hypothetical protein